jgi:hypothetical protein
MELVRIPKRFYQDHHERGLPTPEVIKSTALHYWIDLNDPATADLMDDANFYRLYMTGNLQRSAEATYNAGQIHED